jgi:hypothetical protein
MGGHIGLCFLLFLCVFQLIIGRFPALACALRCYQIKFMNKLPFHANFHRGHVTYTLGNFHVCIIQDG